MSSSTLDKSRQFMRVSERSERLNNFEQGDFFRLSEHPHLPAKKSLTYLSSIILLARRNVDSISVFVTTVFAFSAVDAVGFLMLKTEDNPSQLAGTPRISRDTDGNLVRDCEKSVRNHGNLARNQKSGP